MPCRRGFESYQWHPPNRKSVMFEGHQITSDRNSWHCSCGASGKAPYKTALNMAVAEHLEKSLETA